MKWLTRHLASRIARENIDVLLAGGVLLLGAIAAVLSATRAGSLVPVGIALAFSSGAYLTSRIWIRHDPEFQRSRGFLLALGSGYFVLLGFVGLSWQSVVYDLPALYFVLVAAATGILAAQIGFVRERDAVWAHVVIVEIFLLATVVRWSVFFSYGSILGVDPWANQLLLENSIIGGALPPGFLYSDFPIFTLLSMQTMLLANLPYKLALAASSGLAVTASVVFIYLIGARLMNRKLGLFAALLVSIGGVSIGFGSHSIIAMSLGIGLFSLLSYLLVRRFQTGDIRFLYLVLFVLMAIIMTHVIVSIIVTLLLAAMLVGRRILISVRVKTPASPVSVVLTVLFLAGMLSYWMYVSGNFWFVGNALRYALVSASGDTTPAVIPWSDLPDFEVVRIRLNESIWVGFAVYGVLSILGRSKRSPGMMLVLGFPLVAQALLVGFANTGYDALLPERWIAFIQFHFSLALAFGMVLLFRNYSRASSLVVPVLVGLVSFTLLTSPIATIQNPFFAKDDRIALLDSEIAAAETLSRVSPDTVVVESYLLLFFRFQLEKSSEVLNQEFLNPDSGEDGLIIILRTFIFDHRLAFTKTDSTKLAGYTDVTTISGSSVLSALEDGSFSRVYDAGTVVAYAS